MHNLHNNDTVVHVVLRLVTKQTSEKLSTFQNAPTVTMKQHDSLSQNIKFTLNSRLDFEFLNICIMELSQKYFKFDDITEFILSKS